MGGRADADRATYWHAIDWLTYATHELPAGVLEGPNGATEVECREMLDELDEFAVLCDRLSLPGHGPFIEACRWHFEHYAHYLSRRRHFSDYETYVQARQGPLRVPTPPVPPGWLQPRPRLT